MNIRMLITASFLILAPAVAEANNCFLFFCFPARHVSRGPATAPQFDSEFCVGVLKAFDDLRPRDLDTFIMSIPLNKRDQARRCIENRRAP